MSVLPARVGIWTRELDALATSRAQEVAADLEDAGWRVLWLPEVMDRDVLMQSALVLAATERLVVATGIARIHARSAWSTATTQHQLDDRFPGRFLLGLGVSHARVVERMYGSSYDRPLEAMRSYLDAVDDTHSRISAPTGSAPVRVLAAVGEKMLALAAERSSGAHTFMAPVAHTAWARERLGPGPLLAPAMKAVLTTDTDRGHEAARENLVPTVQAPAYRSLLLRHGFTEDDLAPPLSDRLVDALAVVGDEDAVRARVEEHLAAGADHVALEVLPVEPTATPLEEWRRLAPALSSL